jgi:aminopeptidase N
MPSWDEPGLKATFSVSVELPADRMSIGNMPVASTDSLPDGQKRVHFATTPKMSTYLLFLGIGDFERIETKVDGTEVGLVVSRGDVEKGRNALTEAVRVLHYYNDYFGIHYPLPKLDLVAAPGVITGGAMENWGAIFYSQQALLFDPKFSTEADRQQVFEVVSHEMAHQWFGDLVTMAWWDDLWLNEGFARWMQTKIADDLHPEWKTGLQALSVAEVGKQADAKPSTHPIVQPVFTASQAEQAFDNITYDKGAAVIGMLEAYVGPAAFREGVRRYMSSHAYRNTVDADLWREVQAVAGKPVLEIEADFTRQPGVPLLKVEGERTIGRATEVVLSQTRFVEDAATIAAAPRQLWHIPVSLNAGGELTTHLLSGSTAVTLAVQGTDAAIINAGQMSFVRTLYPQPVFNALVSQIARAKPVDQLGLLYDAWALGQSGYAPVTNYLDLTRALPIDADPIVWIQVISTLVSIDKLYDNQPGQPVFRRFARERLNPLSTQLRWDVSPNEEGNAAILRDAVITALSRFEDREVVAEAQRRFALVLKAPKEVSPAVRRTVLSVVARHANAQTLSQLMTLLRTTQDPLEKQSIVIALTGIADPAGAQRVLDLAIGSDAPAGTQPYILFLVAQEHPDLAWKFSVQHVDQPGFPIDSQVRLFLMPAIAGNSKDRQRAKELQAYADEHIPSSAHQAVEAAIAGISLNVKFREERLPHINEWLASRTAP